MSAHSPSIMIVTGEASGDHHGALVLQALKARFPDVRCCGIGGDELQRSGMHLLQHNRKLAVVGVVEVLSHASHILRAFRVLRKAIRTSPPDLIIFIDYPDFNLRMAAYASRRGVPVLYYISPQIWAWRQGRAKKIARIVDTMAVIFPFEVPFYAKVGLKAHFVGHPLMDRAPDLLARTAALERFALTDTWPIVGLLPGSRAGEIRRLLGPMITAAVRIHARYPDAQFIIPAAPGVSHKRIMAAAAALQAPLRVIPGDFYNAVNCCDIALVTSGTATLQTALLEKPMIIVYRISPLTYFLGRMLIRVPCIGLANIVAGEKIVPELIQHEATGERIADEALALLSDDTRRSKMQRQLGEVKQALGGPGASERIADLAAEMLNRRRA
ncbi:MAG: lipid-A-disaccharide synthase [Deltaproteobacteria bacterium]|nr:lipid-A-disaccharide synthase [Deltaproteobacteria bacterium]